MDLANEKSDPLQPLVGEELSAVVFVRDYIQFQFDGPGLTAVNDPTVEAQGRIYQPAVQGYRDALCERIGHSVVSAEIAEGQEIRIEFDDHSKISISLRPDDYAHGPEAAIFDHGEDTWVW
jgi:hypothetical protein